MRLHKRFPLLKAALMSAALALTAGCRGDAPETPTAAQTAPAQPARMAVPLDTRTLMVDVIAPATNPIWEYAYADTITDEQWTEIRQGSATVAASMAATSWGGTDDNGRSADPRWQEWAREVARLVQQTGQAAEEKNQVMLQMAGDTLVEACGACHSVYLPGAAPPVQ